MLLPPGEVVVVVVVVFVAVTTIMSRASAGGDLVKWGRRGRISWVFGCESGSSAGVGVEGLAQCPCLVSAGPSPRTPTTHGTKHLQHMAQHTYNTRHNTPTTHTYNTRHNTPTAHGTTHLQHMAQHTYNTWHNTPTTHDTTHLQHTTQHTYNT